MKLDQWQLDVLKCENDVLLCTGRRVGKTLIMAIKAVERMLKKPKTEIVVVSLTEDQAQLIIAMALNYADEKYRKLVGKGKFKPTKNKLYFNKGLMQARPVGQTGDSVRGFKGDVLIVDEASRMPKLMWIAARPILLTSGNASLWMCSTPFGKEGYFWDKFDEAYNKKHPKARFEVFYTSTEKVMNERPISSTWNIAQRENALKMLEEEKRDMSTLEYGQEYLGLFLEDLMRLFSDELIDKVCTLKRRDRIIKHRKYYLGCDVARMGGDQITFEIIEKIDEETYHHVESITTEKKRLTYTEEEIVRLQDLYKFRGIGIDAGSGSMGVALLDFLLRVPQIARKLHALNNRQISTAHDGKNKQRLFKEDMYNLLLAMMERGTIALLNDEEVKASLRSIQYELIVKQGEASRRRVFGNFGHVAEGLCRSLWLAREDKTLNLYAY